ncbi:hypothetical protein CMUS01_11534 [Colletotrichum musicola]|uniref:Uncharacterized protein n=1 Tax=Colletotrichum musicola TaxID=2175873 RepID=A0A8H6JX59_9PEZI|nr:hypothetical protein CMUS01_11534 [Colletotrichum musicola]
MLGLSVRGQTATTLFQLLIVLLFATQLVPALPISSSSSTDLEVRAVKAPKPATPKPVTKPKPADPAPAPAPDVPAPAPAKPVTPKPDTPEPVTPKPETPETETPETAPANPATPAKPKPAPADPAKPVTNFPVIDSVAAAHNYVKPPAKDHGMFWSGIPFEESQKAATRNGLQTLEQSVPAEIKNHPDAVPKTPNNPIFWDRFSQAYSNTLVEGKHTIVTVALRAPSTVLTGPSDPFKDGRMVQRSDWAEIEFPTMKAAGIKVMAIHPVEDKGVTAEPYEIWPNDEGYKWQASHGNAVFVDPAKKTARDDKYVERLNFFKSA